MDKLTDPSGDFLPVAVEHRSDVLRTIIDIIKRDAGISKFDLLLDEVSAPILDKIYEYDLQVAMNTGRELEIYSVELDSSAEFDGYTYFEFVLMAYTKSVYPDTVYENFRPGDVFRIALSVMHFEDGESTDVHLDADHVGHVHLDNPGYC